MEFNSHGNECDSSKSLPTLAWVVSAFCTAHNCGSRRAAEAGLGHPSFSTAQQRTKNSARTDGEAWALLARKARTKQGLLGSSCEPDNREA